MPRSTDSAPAQLATIPHRGLTSAEARQESAARRDGLCWLRTLSAGGTLTRLVLSGLACRNPLSASCWVEHQLSALRELIYDEPRYGAAPQGRPSCTA